MNLKKVNLNPIAIKNYLFELDLIEDFEVKQVEKKIEDKTFIETHFNFLLRNNSMIEVYRNESGELLVNNKVITSWEELEEEVTTNER